VNPVSTNLPFATRLLLGAALVGALTAPVPARSGPGVPQNIPAKVEAPKTPQEHRAMAEMYRQKAEESRKDAQSHRKMLADYKKWSYQPKSSMEAGDIKKMRLHCERYIKAAETLATEADELAKYHEMRAKELEGK
jgi:hypothetical protein